MKHSEADEIRKEIEDMKVKKEIEHQDINSGVRYKVHRREPGCRLSGCQGTRVKLAGCPITRVRQIPGWKVIRVESYPGAIYPGAKSRFCIFFHSSFLLSEISMLNVKRKSESL